MTGIDKIMATAIYFIRHCQFDRKGAASCPINKLKNTDRRQ